MRQAIGALMARSKREIPHYYLSTTIDIGAATTGSNTPTSSARSTRASSCPALLIKATALAVAEGARDERIHDRTTHSCPARQSTSEWPSRCGPGE